MKQNKNNWALRLCETSTTVGATAAAQSTTPVSLTIDGERNIYIASGLPCRYQYGCTVAHLPMAARAN